MQPTTMALLLQIASDPTVQYVAGMLVTAGGVGVTWAIKTKPQAREYAQELADLSEAIEPIVRVLEATHLTGPIKLSKALDAGQAWMLEQGITGDAKAVLAKHLPALIEVAVAKTKPPPPKQEVAPMSE